MPRGLTDSVKICHKYSMLQGLLTGGGAFTPSVVLMTYIRQATALEVPGLEE